MNNKSTGFTLVELLIAVSILSALLFTGTYVYQMLAERWDKELGEFNNSVTISKHFSLFNNLLKGIHPFIVIDEKSDIKKPAFLFIGHNKRLLSVSRTGLFNPSYPEIFRISAKQKESGLYDLIYQSVSTKKVLLLTAQQEITFDNQIILFNDLDDINFEYLGWSGFVEQSNAPETGIKPRWRNTFSGIDHQQMPIKMLVRLNKEQNNIVFTIELDRGSLRFLTPYMDDQYDS